MNTFESGVKRRDRKFQFQSCLRRVSAQGEAWFLRNAARKSCTLRAGTAGTEGGLIRLPDQAAPSRPNKPHPNRRVSPCLCSQPFQHPALLRPPQRDAADRQNRLPAFTHPPTDAQRTTVTPPRRVPTDHKRGNAPDPHPHALPGRRNGAILAIRAHQAKPPSSYDTPPRQIYEPLLAYMNKQALAHEFPYAIFTRKISDALLVKPQCTK